MIVSVSRRSDVPAFHGEWFLRALRSRTVEVPHPFRKDVRYAVDLSREAVTCFVFWTRNATPFYPVLDELDRRGYRYAFLVTLTGYGKRLEPGLPPPETCLRGFRALAERAGKERITWRYDPILFTDGMDERYHREQFDRIAGELESCFSRCIVSVADPYPDVRRRLGANGIPIVEPKRKTLDRIFESMATRMQIAGIPVQTCAEAYSGSIPRGGCIDADWLSRAAGVPIRETKDPGQRKECLCVRSRDIGTYGTCRHGCLYCYARRD